MRYRYTASVRDLSNLGTAIEHAAKLRAAKEAEDAERKRVSEWDTGFRRFLDVVSDCASSEELSFRVEVTKAGYADCAGLNLGDIGKQALFDALERHSREIVASVAAWAGIYPMTAAAASAYGSRGFVAALFEYLDAHDQFLCFALGGKVYSGLSRLRFLKTPKTKWAFDAIREITGRFRKYVFSAKRYDKEVAS